MYNQVKTKGYIVLIHGKEHTSSIFLSPNNPKQKNQGLTSTVIENNGYKSLICEIGTEDSTLIFNGHVDVVCGKPEQFQLVSDEETGGANCSGHLVKMGCPLQKKALNFMTFHQ